VKQRDIVRSKTCSTICLAPQATTEGTILPEMSASLDGSLKRNAEDEDSEIVGRCRRGDTEAFAALVRKYQKKMLNIAYRMVGNYDEACDVVQDAFLSAYKGIGKFRGDARFSTWLCGIVMNQARTHLQNRTAQLRRTALSLDDLARSEAACLMREPVSPETVMVERLEKHQMEATVQACISDIAAGQREVLVLRDMQGLSYEAISEALRLPAGTVRSRLFRARHELKERLMKVLGERQ
jgi:RNA polymerase sigma-70 factor, ECF subfamily